MFPKTLVELLQSLNREEFQSLGNFLQSPYFNKNERVLRLYNLAKKAYPNFEFKKNNKEKLAGKLFPDNKKPALALRRLMTGFTALVEDFLAHEWLKRNEYGKKTGLREELFLRGIDEQYEKAYKACVAIQNIEEQESPEYYYNDYYLEKEWNSYLLMRQNRSKEADHQKVLNKLEVFYAVSKLQKCCAIKNMQNLFSIEYDFVLLDEQLKAIAENDFLHKVPVIELYASLLQFLMNDDEAYFFKFISRLDSLPALSRTELDMFYITSINYCIRKNREGKQKFLEHTFNLYESMMRNDLLINNGKIFPSDYINITGTAVKINAMEKAEAFVKKYKQYLPEDKKESIYMYCKASIAFHSKQYEKVLKYLISSEKNDQFSKINNEMLIIKAYYELKEFLVLESRLEAFRIYLHRKNDLSNNIIKAYQNVTNIIKRLCRLSNSLEKAMIMDKSISRLCGDIEKLMDDIEATQPITDKAWLQSKAEELMSKVP